MITHVQKIPVTMQLDVFTLILALNVVLKTNVILTIVFLLLDDYNDVACLVDDPLLFIVIPIYEKIVILWPQLLAQSYNPF
jgi:hypothetical protein